MAEEILININVEGEENLKNVGNKLEETGKKANKTQSEIQRLRKELRDSKSAMLEAAEGSETYNRALARSAEIQTKLKDANDKTRAAMLDIGVVAKNISSVTAAAAGGFGALTGTLTLLGIENENVLKSIQKLQAVMSIVQGLTAFADGIDALKELMDSLKASTQAAAGASDIFNKSQTTVTQTADESSKAISELSKESATMASNVAGVNSVNQKLDSGLKDINKNLTKNIDLTQVGNLAKKQTVNITELGTAATTKDTVAKEANTKAVVAGTSAVQTFGKTIATTILSMAAFTAVILGVFYAIEKLIEYINKVPEDVKIKLKLEEDVFNEYQKVLEKVKKFEYDLNRARTKEQKAQLDEIAKKEFNLTDERLKQIKATANGWKLFFTEYLKLAKDTYYNEALIKQKVEATIQSQSTAARRDVVLGGIESLMKQEGFSDKKIKETLTDIRSGKRVAVGLQIDTQVREWRRLNEEVINFNQNLRALNKIPFKDLGGNLLSDLTYRPTPEKTEPTRKLPKAIQPLRPRGIKGLTVPVTGGPQMPTTLPVDLGGGIAQTFADYNEYYAQGLIDYKTYLDKRNLLTMAANKTGATIQLEDLNRAAELDRFHFEEMMDIYSSLVSSLSSITDSISSIYDSRLQTVQNYYDAEAALVEQSTMTEEMKNKKLAELDKKRYEEQKVLFEQQKAWQIASVGLNLASGLMNIYTNATLPVAMGGTPRPFNWIAAGLEVAALIAQATSQISNINAQTLNGPAGVGSATNPGSAVANISALSPTRTALTSNEENLNMMRAATDSKYQSVVKVSEINNVQSRVSVREQNTIY